MSVGALASEPSPARATTSMQRGTDPKRIIHVLAPGDVGGMESVVRLLARGQRDRGDRPLVVSVVESERHALAFREALAHDGVRQEALVLPGRAYRREWRAIRDLCRREQAEIVHTHGYRADLVAGSAARRAGVATVSTVHGFTGGDWKLRLFERLDRYAFRRFDAVTAVSRPLVELLAGSGVSRRRIHLHPNAFDVRAAVLARAEARRHLAIPDDAWRVGWVGRLSAEKGPDVVVRAMEQLGDASLSMLGDGAERDALLETSARLGVAGRIQWHGVVHDASRVLPAFDVLVLSSRTEGTPVVLLEAMAAGVPIVATRVGGIPDVVGEHEALLVPPDDPHALAAAIAAVRRDPARAAQRAAAARARLLAERGLESWLTGYERIYDAALAVAARSA